MRRASIPLVVLLLFASGCAAITPAAAVVNGQKIPESTLQEEVDRVRDDPSFRELLRQQGDPIRGLARRQVLARFVRETVIEQQARRRGVRISSAQIDAFVADLRRQVGGAERFTALLTQANLTADRVRILAERQLYQQELAQSLASKSEPPEDRVRAYYDQNAASLTEFHVLRITTRTQEEAAQVVQQANLGTDFAALARKSSTDPAAQSGGDLGFADAEALGGALASQIEAAPDGAIVGPLRGAGGFEVYKVAGRRTKPFETVRAGLAEQLRESDARDAFETWITGRIRGARIVVNPKYGRFDAQTLQVVQGPGVLPE